MFALPDLLEETRQKLKQTYGNEANGDTLSMVWGHTCIFVEEQMVKGKAVAFPGLGTFTFAHKKKELGNKGTRVIRHPVFYPADSFCQMYDLKKETLNLFVSVPSVTLNNSWIASQSSATRDMVIDFHKEAVRAIGNSIRAGKNLSIEFENIGALTCANETLKLLFNSDFVAQIRVFNSPAKSGNASENQSVASDPDTVKSPPKLRVNNLVLSPIQSRAITPYQDPNRAVTPNQEARRVPTPSKESKRAATPAQESKEVLLPQVDVPDRPQAPLRKQRTSSDLTPLRPLSQGFQRQFKKNDVVGDKEEEGEEEEGKCEDCIIKDLNDRAARLKKMQERAMEEMAVRTQHASFQALDETEMKNLKSIKARREDADVHNRVLLAQQAEAAAREKQADFYGDVLYSRKPDTPLHKKKAKYKTLLEEQMEERKRLMKQQQTDAKKDFEVFHETQKEADERARRKKEDERSRQKEYSDYLMQQIASRPPPEPLQPVTSPLYERSLPRPASTPSSLSFTRSIRTPPLTTSLSTSLFERQRPSTAQRDARRKTLDSGAFEQAREALQQRRQQQDEEKAKLAKEQLSLRREYEELRQKQIDEDNERKAHARELLKNAWTNQLDQKRTVSFAEEMESSKPARVSLDLGELEAMKPKKCCAECGRGITEPKNFRITSGDFRLTTNELAHRRALSSLALTP